MTTVHTANISLLRVEGDLIWSDGLVSEQSRRAPFGLERGKRMMGLDILRPRSSTSIPKHRISTNLPPPTPSSSSSTSATSPIPSRFPLGSLSPTGNSLYGGGSKSTPPSITTSATSQSLASFLSEKDVLDSTADEEAEQEERRLRRREEQYQSQRAVLRTSRSISQFPPPPDSSNKGKEKDTPNVWRSGIVQVQAYGAGGVYGGSLRISAEDISARSITLPPIHRLKTSSPSSLRDVRIVHPSLTRHQHVICITICGDTASSSTSGTASTSAPPSASPGGSSHLARARASQLGDAPLSLYDEGQLQQPTRKKSGRPSTSASTSTTRTLAALGKRARGLTLSSTPPPSTPTPSAHSPSLASPEMSAYRKVSGPLHSASSNTNDTRSIHSNSNDQSISDPTRPSANYQTFLLSFPTRHEQHEWYSLLLSLCVPERRSHRRHRRLSVKVLDLQERLITAGYVSMGSMHQMQVQAGVGAGSRRYDESASQYTHTPGDVRSVKSKDVSGAMGKGKDKERVRAGWAVREKICCEVLLDGQPYARTSWQSAEDRSTSPFWGESLDLDDIPECSSCVVKMYRLNRNRPLHFASVDIPLIPSFRRQDDERYPISVVSSSAVPEGMVIGELRLVVAYHDLIVLPRETYSNLKLMAPNGNQGANLVHDLSTKGTLDGSFDLLVRIGLAEGTLLDWLKTTCQLEAQASGETLFRGNTPLSKALEATMRMFTHDFLLYSIGPTIERVLSEKLALELNVLGMGTGTGMGMGGSGNGVDSKEQEIHGNGHGQGAGTGTGQLVDTEGLEGMRGLVQDCWADMYHARGTFPDFLRHVFAHLFKSVKEHHGAADDDHLRFKAISSFLFLRLIGPALMRPHLFGLADGMPSAGVRRTLTLLAKVLHSLAFFTEKDGRDPELACFSSFIKENSEVMLDYLSSLTSPLDDHYRPPIPSPIGRLVSDRCARGPTWLSDRVPVLTPIGPVDLTADQAVLVQTLHERRQLSLRISNAGQAPTTTIAEQELDAMLQRVEDLSETARTRKESTASTASTATGKGVGIGTAPDMGDGAGRSASVGSSYFTASASASGTGGTAPGARGRNSLSMSISSDSASKHGAEIAVAVDMGNGVQTPIIPSRNGSLAVPLTGGPLASQPHQQQQQQHPASIDNPNQFASRRSISGARTTSPPPALSLTPNPTLLTSPSMSFRDKITSPTSWRWLSFGGAGGAAPMPGTEPGANASTSTNTTGAPRTSYRPSIVHSGSGLEVENVPQSPTVHSHARTKVLTDDETAIPDPPDAYHSPDAGDTSKPLPAPPPQLPDMNTQTLGGAFSISPLGRNKSLSPSAPPVIAKFSPPPSVLDEDSSREGVAFPVAGSGPVLEAVDVSSGVEDGPERVAVLSALNESLPGEVSAPASASASALAPAATPTPPSRAVPILTNAGITTDSTQTSSLTLDTTTAATPPSAPAPAPAPSSPSPSSTFSKRNHRIRPSTSFSNNPHSQAQGIDAELDAGDDEERRRMKEVKGQKKSMMEHIQERARKVSGSGLGSKG